MRSMTRFAAATVGAVLLSTTLLAPPALAANNGNDAGQTNGNGHQGNTHGFSFGVIGDVPYGDAEIQAFPSYVQDLNAHKELNFVAHVGDIKNGSSQCTDQYFEAIKKTLTASPHRSSTPRATTSGQTATARTTEPTTPWKDSPRFGTSSSPSPGSRSVHP